METLEQQFNSRVSAFLTRTGMKPTTLGMKAVGDPSLMRRIGLGRSPSLRTADRVLAFIDGYNPDEDGTRDGRCRGGRRSSSSGTERTGGTRAKTEQPMNRNTRNPIRILRSPEVEARTGLSRSTIYRWRVAGRFPPPVVMGGRTVGWIESDVDAWIRERAVESRAGGAAVARRPPRARKRR